MKYLTQVEIRCNNKRMVGFVEQKLAVLGTKLTLDVRGIKDRDGVWEVVAVYGTEKEDYVAWSIQVGKVLKES